MRNPVEVALEGKTLLVRIPPAIEGGASHTVRFAYPAGVPAFLRLLAARAAATTAPTIGTPGCPTSVEAQFMGLADARNSFHKAQREALIAQLVADVDLSELGL